MSLVLNTGLGLGGGSDKHNLGWFADDTALAEAYPVGNDGDYALVGSTDTIWTWDSDTAAWVDTDRKGQVSSVNNETGDVTVQETLVNQQNIKSINGSSILGSGNLEIAAHLNYPSSWPTTSSSTTKAFCDAVAADATAIEGKMYLGEVRWNDLPASMVNAEVVVEIMSGTTSSNKVIKLTCTSGNRSPYLWIYTYWNGGSNVSGWKGFQPELPSQSGQSGKFLTTDGSSISWGSVDALPAQSGQSGKFLTTNGSVASWANVDALPSQTGNSGKVLSTNGTSASWIDITSTPATTPTLVAANWSSNTQTINVTGVTSSNVVLVGPSPVSAEDYAAAGVLCTSQGNGTLTFTCDTTPSVDLTLNVVCF